MMKGLKDFVTNKPSVRLFMVNTGFYGYQDEKNVIKLCINLNGFFICINKKNDFNLKKKMCLYFRFWRNGNEWDGWWYG